VNFSNASRIYESIRMGGKKREALSSIDTEKAALNLYSLLYPDKKLLTKGGLSSMFANEVGVFIDVVIDILGNNSLSLSLAQESNKSSSQGWTVNDAKRMMESVSLGALGVLDVSYKMDEIEARLFWNCILGEKSPITPRAFVIHLGVNKGLPIDVMKRHAHLKDTRELIHSIYTDPEGLDIPNRWYEETKLALSPRRYLPFHPHESIDKVNDFNNSFYQRLSNKGSTKMLYVISEHDGVRFVWRDRSGKIVSNGKAPDISWLPKTPMILETSTDGNNIHVYDAIFPRYPNLTLIERLVKLEKHTKNTPIIVHHPTHIDSIVELISSLSDGDAIRFPNMDAYEPFSNGGLVLMTSLSKMYLRLHSVKIIEDTLSLKLSCVDGYDDFIEVGNVDVYDSVKNSIQSVLGRMTLNIFDNSWKDIDDDCIIVLEVIVPAILKDPLTIPDALVSCVREDLGISDITQYVDFLYTS